MQPYKKLFTYWYALIIYDLTVEFCDRFDHAQGRPERKLKGDRWIKSWKLKEQMNGAARSGKQNIVEGSDNLKTSLKIAIKLTGIAKGSLEELLGDLEDFLRQRGLPHWSKNDQRVKLLRAKSAKLVRNLSNLGNLRDPATRGQKQRELLAQLPLPKEPEPAANLLLTLCHQATYLLNKQVDSLEKKHTREGGLTEKLYQKRKEYRGY